MIEFNKGVKKIVPLISMNSLKINVRMSEYCDLPTKLNWSDWIKFWKNKKLKEP